MSAVVRIEPEVPAFLRAPKFGPWQVAERPDGTFCIRQASEDGKATNTYGHFNNRLLAVNLAADENAKRAAAECICDSAFPGPIEKQHCPACAEKGAA